MTLTASIFTGSHGTKSLLAKLLATENITVMHDQKVNTAYFDVDARVLVLPTWKDISEDLYDMLVVHEVGHALNTIATDWLAAIKSLSLKHYPENAASGEAVVKDVLNIVEDARIDKLQKRRYPGSRKNYIAAYDELMKRDFFKLKKNDVNLLGILDKLNVYFKTNVLFNSTIKFSKEDLHFVKRMIDVETWNEVVKISDDLLTYARREALDSDGNSSSGNSPMKNVLDGITTLLDELSNSSGEGDDESEKEGRGSEVKKEGEDGKEEGKELLAKKSPGGRGNTPSTERVQTVVAQEDFMKSISDGLNTHYRYYPIPEFDYDKIIDLYPKVLVDMKIQMKENSTSEATKIKSSFINWKTAERETVNFMVKEFERKKAASLSVRTRTSKTGVLNTNKLYSYAYNDDIFRKLTEIPKGKSHGLVLFLDWSGSMRDYLLNSIKQLLSLVLFCKRAQIPFDVYTFRSISAADNVPSFSVQTISTKEEKELKNNTILGFLPFKLRNVLSSKMHITDLNFAMEFLWSCAYNRSYRIDQMMSTPLNQTLLVASEIIKRFKESTKVEIISTVVITDGSSDGANNYNNLSRYNTLIRKPYKTQNIIRDPITKKDYYVPMETENQGYLLTNAFAKILKNRTNCTLLGIYISKQSSVGRYFAKEEDVYSEENKKLWKNEKYLSIKNAGYDEYYIVNVDTYAGPSNLESTKNIEKEFSKLLVDKKINRSFLSRFIENISKSAV